MAHSGIPENISSILRTDFVGVASIVVTELVCVRAVERLVSVKVVVSSIDVTPKHILLFALKAWASSVLSQFCVEQAIAACASSATPESEHWHNKSSASQLEPAIAAAQQGIAHYGSPGISWEKAESGRNAATERIAGFILWLTKSCRDNRHVALILHGAASAAWDTLPNQQ